MAKLVLKFDNNVIREVPLGQSQITIGRAPDNDLQIDNLAISDHHARIWFENGRLKIMDLDSLNGVAVNGTPVKQEWLNSGDIISIGKHVILVDLYHDVVLFERSKPKGSTPKIEETYVLDDRAHSDPGRRSKTNESTGESSHRVRTPSLIVVKGKIARTEYLLSNKLTLIGKSSLASVQLKGWFAPQAAAQITKRQDGYYLNSLSRAARINGSRVTGATRLTEGDVIKVWGVSLIFTFRES